MKRLHPIDRLQRDYRRFIMMLLVFLIVSVILTFSVSTTQAGNYDGVLDPAEFTNWEVEIYGPCKDPRYHIDFIMIHPDPDNDISIVKIEVYFSGPVDMTEYQPNYAKFTATKGGIDHVGVVIGYLVIFKDGTEHRYIFYAHLSAPHRSRYIMMGGDGNIY